MNFLRKILINLRWNRGAITFLILLLIITYQLFLKIFLKTDYQTPKNVLISPIIINVPNSNLSIKKSVFRVYYPINNLENAEILAKLLVEQFKSTELFTSVQLVYYLNISKRNQIIMTGDSDKKFNLLFIKPSALRKLTLDEAIQYIPIASYDGYPSYIIGKEVMPVINDKYTFGKKLGLLVDPLSESGHRYPKKIIKKNISKSSWPEFVSSYTSHKNLRTALENGEVDFIGSYWTHKDNKKFPSWKPLKIGTIPKGITWFLEAEENKSEVACKIKKTLEKYSQMNTDSYWKNITFPINCDN